MRKVQFANGEHYHVYNRGVDHRQIILDEKDSERFLLGLDYFNSVESIGAIKAFSDLKDKPRRRPLVNIIAYCLNPNHFHLILEQLVDNGVSIFVKSLSGGYAKYFNIRNKRTGTLYEGPFKVKHIADNDYLLHLSSYVNLNDKLHRIGQPISKIVRSSWREFCESKIDGICIKGIILEQFGSPDEYKKFALDFLPDMLTKKGEYKDLENLLFD
ncbi:MAG TPA: transposase [Candidatus Paceibacterota bacterium]